MRYSWKAGLFGGTRTLDVDVGSVTYSARGKQRRITFDTLECVTWSYTPRFGLGRPFLYLMDKSGAEISFANLAVRTTSVEGNFDQTVVEILRRIAVAKPEMEVLLGYSPRVRFRVGLLVAVVMALVIGFQTFRTNANVPTVILLIVISIAAGAWAVVGQSGGLNPKRIKARELAEKLSVPS